jgi:DNA-nicking Smr family endonuclease
MRKHRAVTPEERALFREAVGRVQRVTSARIPLRPAPPKPVPWQTRADTRRVLAESLCDSPERAGLETGEELSFLRDGLQASVLRKLRRGEFRVHAELDLHGMTTMVARIVLGEFLVACARGGARCVRIVHGKGLRSRGAGPVLKTKVNLWLRQREDILAFCSARNADGGTGAIYVLLTRGR